MKQTRAEEMPYPELAAWFFWSAEKWPQIFDGGDLGQLWAWSEQVAGEDRALFARTLRAGLLKRLAAYANGCQACALGNNRLNGRAVLDDSSYGADPFKEKERGRQPIGATGAEIMVIGEGPGNFEARAGQPFVSYHVLAGSHCARSCGEYEACYPEGARFPAQACAFVPIKELVVARAKEMGADPSDVDQLRKLLPEIYRERTERPAGRLHTAGQILDAVLMRAKLWRESWNGYGELRGKERRPATVYLTNVVKCRSCAPDGQGGLKDKEPTVAELAACRPLLEAQLYILQPRVIVPLGAPAIRQVLGLKEGSFKVGELRGKLVRGPGGIPVLPEYHPSYILRIESPDAREKLIGEAAVTFQDAKAIAAGELTAPWQDEVPAIQIPAAQAAVAAAEEEAGILGEDDGLNPEAMLTVPTFAPEIAARIAAYVAGSPTLLGTEKKPG